MKEKILELLNEKDFVSGEHLAKKLGVSRTAVWKQINNLKKIGYKIESVKNKGYRLSSTPDIPIETELKKGLKTKIIGQKTFYFPEIESTNQYAKKIVADKIEEGTVVVSDVQTKGRGRKNRGWSSPKGGLWFSVILYPNIPPERGMLITMTASVSVAQAIEEITGLRPVIKWPNDLLVNGKKVCGILTELDAEIDKINYSIVGIGINVNNKIKKELKSKAISLNEVGNLELPKVKLLQSILTNFDLNYSKIMDNNYIRNLWFSYSNIIGKEIEVQRQKDTVKGIVSSVDESGCLIIKSNGKQIRIVSGDIIFL